MKKKIKVVVFIYDGFTLLDAVGPIQCLGAMENTEIIVASIKKGMVVSDSGIKFEASDSFINITSCDILVVAGGLTGTFKITRNKTVLDWIKKMDKHTVFTSSVCTGSWILAAAGLLNGKKSACHWYGKTLLQELGAYYVKSRYVFDGKYATAAGVSAGMDLAFALIDKLKGEQAAKETQLSLQYAPEPMFDCGNPEGADPGILQKLTRKYDLAFKTVYYDTAV